MIYNGFDRKYVFSSELEMQSIHHGGNSRKELQEASTATATATATVLDSIDRSYPLVNPTLLTLKHMSIVYPLFFFEREREGAHVSPVCPRQWKVLVCNDPTHIGPKPPVPVANACVRQIQVVLAAIWFGVNQIPNDDVTHCSLS